MSHSVNPWTVAHQAPVFMEFSRQEYWSGLPFPSPGGLPDASSPASPSSAGRFFTTEPPCSSCSVTSHVQLFATPWIAAHQTSLSFTISWSLLKLMSIESVMPSNHLGWLDSKRPECILIKWEEFQVSAGRLEEGLWGEEQKGKRTVRNA